MISKKNSPVKREQQGKTNQIENLSVKSIAPKQSPVKGDSSLQAKYYDFFSYQGTREYNEDKILIKQHIKIGALKLQLFAVFDGHGGSSTSDFLKIYFSQVLQDCVAKGRSQKGPGLLLREAIIEVERKIMSNGNKMISGSCGTFLLICQETRSYYAANVGDSRILFVDEGGEVRQITEDHKPESEKEKLRIIENGGEIYRSSFTHPQTNDKIFGPWRTLPGKLAVSRTFGDCLVKRAKKGVIIAEPDLFEGPLPENSTLLLMSDGAYEKIENQEFSHFFCNELSLENQLSSLIKIIIKRKTNDNVSLIAIKTQALSSSPLKAPSLWSKPSLSLTACSEEDRNPRIKTE